MKKTVYLLIFALLLSFLFSCEGELVNKPEETAAGNVFVDTEGDFTGFKADSIGHYIYRPYEGTKWGYRYGPSILVNEDGSMDAYFSAPGSFGQADFIVYKHSDDGGQTWGKEKSVLQPTPGSEDWFSCCDPGVIFFGGYYYIGYTSTIDKDSGGLNNNGFVARSKNPDGPFEKWNGKGWGGAPAAVIDYTGSSSFWGDGELSFTIKGDTLYIYYTHREGATHYMRSCVADATDENWPATIEDHRDSIEMYTLESGVDVKYDPVKDKFIAVAVVDSFNPESSVHFYLSDDGRKFTENCIAYENFHNYAHNIGLVYNADGTIDIGSFSVAYAFGSEWGHWATLLTPISSFESDHIIQDGKTFSGKVETNALKTAPEQLAVSTKPHHLNITKEVGGSVEIYRVNEDFSVAQLSFSDVEYKDYDSDIISIDENGFITGKAIGKSYITVKHGEYECLLLITVHPDGTDLTSVVSEYGD